MGLVKETEESSCNQNCKPFEPLFYGGIGLQSRSRRIPVFNFGIETQENATFLQQKLRV